MLAITPPGGVELLIILFVLVVLAAVVAGVVRVVRLANRRGTRRTGRNAPSDQQPPPGYWWDGKQGNPPAEPRQ